MGFVSFVFFVFFVILGWGDAVAQDYLPSYGPKAAIHLSRESGELAGPSMDALFGGLDPVVQHWYLPRILPQAARWQQWDHTNWVEPFYRSYLDPGFLGDYWYDPFGRPLRGWLVYDWSQTQPREFGSVILASGFMRGLILAAEQKGEYHLSMTIGSRIRTVLTPMTFSKPQFSGVRWDFSSNEYTGTVLLSRISSPQGAGQAIRWGSATHLIGGRVLRPLGNSVTVGATFLNAHQSNTSLPFAGAIRSPAC